MGSVVVIGVLAWLLVTSQGGGAKAVAGGIALLLGGLLPATSPIGSSTAQ